MHKKNSDEISQVLTEKIISVAYNDAGIFDKISVYSNALINKTVRNLLKEYKLTSRAIHNIEIEETPEKILDNVRESLNINRTENKISSKIYIRTAHFFSDVRYSIAVAGFLVLSVSAYLVFQHSSQQSKYTKEEIELAQKQFNETMSIVNRVFKDTSEQLNEEVLKNHVSKSFNKGFNLVNELITGG